jgi:hypothetical protein
MFYVLWTLFFGPWSLVLGYDALQLRANLLLLLLLLLLIFIIPCFRQQADKPCSMFNISTPSQIRDP